MNRKGKLLAQHGNQSQNLDDINKEELKFNYGENGAFVANDIDKGFINPKPLTPPLTQQPPSINSDQKTPESKCQY